MKGGKGLLMWYRLIGEVWGYGRELPVYTMKEQNEGQEICVTGVKEMTRDKSLSMQA